jgi:hypothetical protein
MQYIQHMVKKPEGVVILRSEFVHDFCSRVKPGLRAEIPNSVNGYLTGLLDNVCGLPGDYGERLPRCKFVETSRAP